MNISIVIPNYNGEHLLQKNLGVVLKSLEFCLKKEGGSGEVIIVDDASTDSSIEVVKNEKLKMEQFDSVKYHSIPGSAQGENENVKIKIVKNEKNLGFASTVNKGAQEAKGEIVVLLNTDVRPEIDFLIPLLKHFGNLSVFGVGCMDKSIEKGKIVLRGRGVGKWEKGLLVHSAGEIGNKNSTLWVSGGSSAFRLSIWKELQGFDELFNPFYWEDIDLSYRAKKAGYKVLFEKESVVTHEHESGSIRAKYPQKYVNAIAYRNQFIFVWKNITDLNLILSHIFWLPFHIIRMITQRDMSFVLGLIQAFILIPRIMKSRLLMTKMFVKTDEEIISQTTT